MRRASIRILVVDDHPDERMLAREILEEEGFIVEEACDGSDALLRVVRDPRPDLVLLDLIMPCLDGWRFMTELRERPIVADIPVVVMTGAGQRTLASAPVSAGYLAKPLDRERLLETIEAALARAKRRKSGSHLIGE